MQIKIIIIISRGILVIIIIIIIEMGSRPPDIQQQLGLLVCRQINILVRWSLCLRNAFLFWASFRYFHRFENFEYAVLLPAAAAQAQRKRPLCKYNDDMCSGWECDQT